MASLDTARQGRDAREAGRKEREEPRREDSPRISPANLFQAVLRGGVPLSALTPQQLSELSGAAGTQMMLMLMGREEQVRPVPAARAPSVLFERMGEEEPVNFTAAGPQGQAATPCFEAVDVTVLPATCLTAEQGGEGISIS